MTIKYLVEYVAGLIRDSCRTAGVDAKEEPGVLFPAGDIKDGEFEYVVALQDVSGTLAAGLSLSVSVSVSFRTKSYDSMMDVISAVTGRISRWKDMESFQIEIESPVYDTGATWFADLQVSISL